MLAEKRKNAARDADPDWAWAPYRPDEKRPWNLARAGHLYRRAAFGANWTQLQRALADGPEKTIDRLLRPARDVASFNHEIDDYETGSNSAESLRAWWLRRMIQTPHPLLEKMTLFWHGHLAASNSKVQNAGLMRRNVSLLRKHALGRFDELLAAVARDPAMLVCLESDTNRKSQPTDHFARALMEQFTLGPGNFSEEDVREAARAMTGWFVLRGEIRFIEREHDAGTKRVLGNRGNFGADDIVKIVVGQPATPRLLVKKLYRWMISETEEPDEKLIAPLARSLAKGYDVSRLVETLLRSNLFFSPVAYRQRVKCPVEFALGIIRGLERLVPTERLGLELATLGQNLYNPPTSRGWHGGRYWLNPATMIGRGKLARALLAAGGPYDGRLDAADVARKHGHSAPGPAARFLLNLFTGGDVPEPVGRELIEAATQGGSGGTSERLRRFAHAVVTLPEFQLA